MFSILLELMKFFHFWRRKSCDKDADPVHPKMQVNMNRMVQPCDGKQECQFSWHNRDWRLPSAAKIVRFKLDVSTSNGWDLPISISMVEYLKEYMHIHIPNKDIKEKILKGNPVPANVKEPQVFDSYTKYLNIEL